jgi:hypothetical protein
VILVFGYGVLLAQSPEEGRLERNGDQMTLFVDSPRPLDAGAMTLAVKFRLRISFEDPPYMYKDDIKDVTAEVSRTPNSAHRVLIPKGGHLTLTFPVRPDGSPRDVTALLRALVDAANAQYPFAFRLEHEGDLFTLIPTRTRDQQGQEIAVIPLLDRRVTIPPGTRSIAVTAHLMADALSAQTGRRVSCCQSHIAGVPWGLTVIGFEAHDEPARSVLKRLIDAELFGHSNPYYWGQSCDPLPSAWCFINLEHLSPPPRLF